MTLIGGRSSDDGEAREYNSATGLDGKTVLMQLWPGGFHRFQRVRRGPASPPPPRVCTDCTNDDYPDELLFQFGPNYAPNFWLGVWSQWDLLEGGLFLPEQPPYAMTRTSPGVWEFTVDVTDGTIREIVEVAVTISTCSISMTTTQTKTGGSAGNGGPIAGTTAAGTLVGYGCLDSEAPLKRTVSGTELTLASIRRPD